MGKYLHEWCAIVVCLHKTSLGRCKVQDWNVVGVMFSKGFLAVYAVHGSGG